MQKKVCMLGSFAVGKTSLVRRFVHSVFSEQYHTTIGVKIDRKSLNVGDTAIDLLLWDIHGEDDFQKVRASYLRGMAGYVLVADGTRSETLDQVESLHQMACQEVGDVPFLLLINKQDLADQWDLDEDRVGRWADAGWTIRRTSAKAGENVEESFRWLAHQMLGE